MIKQLVCAAIITGSMYAMDSESRKIELENVPGVPKKEAIEYLNALEDMQEIDPISGEPFEWLDCLDYEFFNADKIKAAIITRYKQAIIGLAHSQRFPTEDLLKAQVHVNADEKTLFYILTGNKEGTLKPAEWSAQWTSMKKEIKQRAIDADAKLLDN